MTTFNPGDWASIEISVDIPVPDETPVTEVPDEGRVAPTKTVSEKYLVRVEEKVDEDSYSVRAWDSGAHSFDPRPSIVFDRMLTPASSQLVVGRGVPKELR